MRRRLLVVCGLLVAAPGAANPAPALGWDEYLDGVERAVAVADLPAARFQALSDALRARRDAALSGGRGALPAEVVRRSARLIARLEVARAALEMGRAPPRPAPAATAPAIFVRVDEAPSPRPETAPPESEGFILDWPVATVRVTSGFGLRPDPIAGRVTFHEGIDLAGEPGEDVRAMGPGEVAFAGWRGDGCGYTVVLRHPGGLRSEYCHLSAIDVDPGDIVPGGARLGGIGSTGRSTGHHLHWAVRIDGQPLDPTDVVGRRSDVVTETDAD